MKKVATLIVVLALVLALSVPALSGGFVPSIQVKLAPEASAVTLVDIDGKEVAGISAEDVIITPVAKAKDADPEIAEQLEAAYDSIKEAKRLTVLVPNLAKVVKDVDPKVKADDLVVRDLFSIFLKGKAAAALEKDGSKLTLEFETKLKPGDTLVVIQYIDGEWVALDPEDVVINKDGTVSVTIEIAAPIAFLTKGA